VFYLTNGILDYCISSDEFCEENARRQLRDHPIEGEVARRLRKIGA